MDIRPIMNEEFGEIDHFKIIEDNGATKTEYIANYDDVGLFHIDQNIYLGDKEIFSNSFTLDEELIKALEEIKRTYI